MRQAIRLGVVLVSAIGCAGVDEAPIEHGEQVAPLSGVLEIDQINVGWGGSVVVVGPDGTTVLLEAGDTGKGTNRVVPYLLSLGIDPADGLDYTIAGHQHCDHIGGLDEVINAGYDVRLANFYNGSSNTSTCVTSWNNAAAGTTAGAPMAPSAGDEIALGGGAKLTFITVNGQIIGGGSVAISDENDRSIAVLIQHGGFDYLWASDMGGGNIDTACTGRSTSSQVNVESSVVQAISPGGAAPRISNGGVDVLTINHHGSESSTNMNWMNSAAPAVALVGTGAGQSSGWEFPRIDVVEHVLLAQAPCITVPAALVLQTEEGLPTGPQTSFSGYCVGNIRVVTDGQGTFTVSADGLVSQGPNEVALAGLPRTIALDDAPPAPDPVAPTTTITAPAGGATISGTVSVTATAMDNIAVTRVELWLDGAFLASDFTAPYGWSWDTTAVTPGSHALQSRAFDSAGNQGVSTPISVTVVEPPPMARVILNEIMANEPGSATAGEYVELVNAGNATANLDGWKISDALAVRHVFAAGTSLPAGQGLVVFAGASAIPPGLGNAVAASTGALSLNNSGDTVRLDDASSGVIDTFTYGSGLAGTDGVSMNRNPDGSAIAPFVLHTVISALGGSPGKRASGQDFPVCWTNVQCSDGNPCNGSELCQAGSCVAGTPPTCSDGNSCTADSCSPATGCAHTAVSDGTSCSDGNVCNGAESCQAGACAAGSPLSCDDGNGCTDDTCAPGSGCAHANNSAACDDGNLCTSGDVCGGGSCGGTPLSCGDGNLCNGNESCEVSTGACVAGTPLSCDDGNPCNGAETCSPATGCTAGTPLSCDDGNPCTADSCSPTGGCQHGPVVDGTACSDGNACNGAETCQAGACGAGAPLSCDDGNACNGAETCSPATGCVAGTPPSCDDGNACNGAETCSPATGCVAGTPPSCDDGNACNGAETCSPATGCVAGTPLSCDDGNACNGAETCSPATGCVAGTPLSCDDGNACNGAETCSQTLGCVAGTPPSCDDGNACNGAETCSPATGCVAGTPPSCDDGNVCNGAETCSPTLGCVAGTPPSCNDGNACNGTETCSPATGCVAGTPLSCDDGNACNGAETCSQTLGCLAGTPPSCDDGNACNGVESCSPATGCVGGAPPSCDDGNPCTSDSCHAVTGCAHVNICVPQVIASDGFESGFGGGTGWSEAAWRVSGDAAVTSDGPHSGANHVRLRRATGSVKRIVSLAGRSASHLRLWARVSSFEGGDRAYVKVTRTPGSGYTIVLTLSPSQSDDQYHVYDLDVGVCNGAASCEIFLDAEMNAVNDIWYVDDVEVTAL